MTIQQEDELGVRRQIEEGEVRLRRQKEAGTRIITDTIHGISLEFNRPDINDFSVERNRDHWYVFDMNRRVVMKLSEEDLTDIPSPSTPEVRRGFQAGLRAHVITHYALSISS